MLGQGRADIRNTIFFSGGIKDKKIKIETKMCASEIKKETKCIYDCSYNEMKPTYVPVRFGGVDDWGPASGVSGESGD